jgi:hypothetical protein
MMHIHTVQSTYHSDTKQTLYETRMIWMLVLCEYIQYSYSTRIALVLGPHRTRTVHRTSITPFSLEYLRWSTYSVIVSLSP